MRQRSKNELLSALRTHRTLQRDINREKDKQLVSNAAFCRVSVEWTYVLWKQEKMRVDTLKKVLDYAVNNYASMTDDRREEIREKMKGNWIFKNMAVRRKCKNAVDQSRNDLQFFNTQVSVDYSLLVVEWLIEQRKYTPEQIDIVCNAYLYVDTFPIEKVYTMRHLIYKYKNIWIELNPDDTKEWKEWDEEVEMIEI